MSLGKIEVFDKPKSKWPYWVLYREVLSGDWGKYDYDHFLIRLKLIRDKTPVVIERQWGVNYNGLGRKYKTQYGVLYKFLGEEDRLIFLMTQEKSE